MSSLRPVLTMRIEHNDKNNKNNDDNNDNNSNNYNKNNYIDNNYGYNNNYNNKSRKPGMPTKSEESLVFFKDEAIEFSAELCLHV